MTDSETTAPTTGVFPQLVVVGNLTIDDVVYPDGETSMGSPGGNTIYSASAASLWGVRVGLVARAGGDFPAEVLARLEAAGLDTTGLRRVAGPTVRNWVIYEHDGSRSWVYRTPVERSRQVAPSPEDIPTAWIGSRGHATVVHVAAMPLPAAIRIVEHLRRVGQGIVITLDTHEQWGSERDSVVDLARRVDVFVPSQEELTALVGYDNPERACGELMGEGVPALVVKRGAQGALVASKVGSLEAIPAAVVPVVDVTGAGDAFCGGLAAGLVLGESLVAAARRASASAGAGVGVSGSLGILRRAELARSLMVGYGSGAAPSLPGYSLAGQNDDSDVMEKEITTIPAVIRDRLALAAQAHGTIERLRDSKIGDLVLVGCGDSSFAAQAAALALNRYSGIRARAVHALDFARYEVRYCQERTAVVAISFSGKTGRTTEAARQARAFGHTVIALTGAPDSPLAAIADRVLSAEIPTFGFAPGTSTFTAMLVSLLTLASGLADADTPEARDYACDLERLPELAEDTIRLCEAPSLAVARRLLGARMVTFLGGGPNEASARFGAAKLFEGAQMIALSTNVEEWAHEQYFITRPGDPVVVVAPSGASSDRAAEILSELDYIQALPVVVSDRQPLLAALHLPLAGGLDESLTPVLASIPLSLIGLHLMRLNGRRSYNFTDEKAAEEHYETIHRATIGKPA